MSRVTHSEPGLPTVCWLFLCLSLTCEGRFTQCKIWWIKWKSCDKNINKRKTSPAGVEQAKEKNGSSLKLLTEHCVTFLLPCFFLISPRSFFSVDQFPCLTDDDSSWFDLRWLPIVFWPRASWFRKSRDGASFQTLCQSRARNHAVKCWQRWHPYF